jgi:hypothetical protein
VTQSTLIALAAVAGVGGEMERTAYGEAIEAPARPRVVVPFPAREGEGMLRAAYDRYRAVAGSVAPDSVFTPEVVEARVALTRLLLADGWDAPVEVHAQLRRDELLLRRVVTAS